MVDYQPFKIQEINKVKAKKEVTPTFAFPGQFLTTSQKEFYAKGTKAKCQCHNLSFPHDFNKTTAYFNPIKRLYFI